MPGKCCKCKLMCFFKEDKEKQNLFGYPCDICSRVHCQNCMGSQAQEVRVIPSPTRTLFYLCSDCFMIIKKIPKQIKHFETEIDKFKTDIDSRLRSVPQCPNASNSIEEPIARIAKLEAELNRLKDVSVTPPSISPPEKAAVQTAEVQNMGNLCQKIPFRVWIACMVFLSTYINYTTRVNMSIAIVSMAGGGKETKQPECLIDEDSETNRTQNGNVTSTQRTLPDYGPRYDWDQRVQSYVLGSYFYGYVPASLFGGWLAERIGPFHVLFWAHVIIGVFNSVTVFSAYAHVAVVILCRIIIGVCAGAVYPALQTLIAKWAPPAERGKFVSCLMGNTLGTCVTWPLVGSVTMAWGWSWGFHVVTIQHLVYLLIFFIVASDSPDKSKFVKEEELNFITEAQGTQLSKKKAKPPLKGIFTSIPFCMLCILHFGNLWGLYVQLTTVPKFMAEVVGFDLRSSGGLAALPHILRLFTGIMFGSLGDFLRSRKIMSPKMIRKGFVLFSHILPGLCLMGLALTKCNAPASVALLVISMGLNGAATITNLRNPQDLAPNFAGTQFGIMSFFGGLTGFIVPAILGELTRANNGTKEWAIHFLIGGSVYCICGVLFILFGSVNIQPWNEIKE